MRIASTAGVEVVLHDLGGDGPPLLVAHATGFCAAPYRPLAVRLHDRFHVWAIDFRGHGDSSFPADGNLAWTGMADDVDAALDALGGGPVHAFGHSMGGAALLLAEQRRPGSLRSAFLYEPIISPTDHIGPAEGGGTDRPTGNHMAETARRRRPGFPTRAEALARYASRPPMNLLRADALYEYVEHGFADQPDGTVALKCTPAAEAATFEGFGRLNLDELPGITLPCVVATGATESEMLPAQMAVRAGDMLPDCHAIRYPTLGHFGPFQDPLAVAADVRTFITDVERRQQHDEEK